MAADHASPWSRWDAPGFQFISTNTQPSPIQRTFFDPSLQQQQQQGFGQPGFAGQSGFAGQQQPFVGSNTFASTMSPGQQSFLRDFGSLIESRVNSEDPNFWDCVYGVANSAQARVEICYKDLGCCANGCCYNGSWHDKYGWAVALIVIFCILVIVSVALLLVVWLFNRSRDKQQKRELLESTNGLSPAASQVSLAQPVMPPPMIQNGGSSGGYYPYASAPANGYRY